MDHSTAEVAVAIIRRKEEFPSGAFEGSIQLWRNQLERAVRVGKLTGADINQLDGDWSILADGMLERQEELAFFDTGPNGLTGNESGPDGGAWRKSDFQVLAAL